VYIRIRPASVPGLAPAGAEAGDAPEGEGARDAALRAAAGRHKVRNGDAGDPTQLASLEPCMWARDAETLCVQPPPGTQAGRAGSGAARAFSFGGVFGGETSQASYYRATLQPLVWELARGALDPGSGACRAASVLAYGMTTAGKTWTVQGSRDDPGLLPRAAAELFEALERGKDASAAPPLLCVTLAMYEVYNEEVYDLLPDACEAWKDGGEEEERRRKADNVPAARPKPRAPLRVRDDADGDVHVEGLRRWRASGLAQLTALLEKGAHLRARAATALNASSSRSHCVVELGVWEAEGAV
ncbi:kinesin, partial [Helicosporidium sp. ATCC 50920]